MPLIGIILYSFFSFISSFIIHFINNILNYFIFINKYLINVYEIFLVSSYKKFKKIISISTLKKRSIDIISSIVDYMNSLINASLYGDPSDRRIMRIIS